MPPHLYIVYFVVLKFQRRSDDEIAKPFETECSLLGTCKVLYVYSETDQSNNMATSTELNLTLYPMGNM